MNFLLHRHLAARDLGSAAAGAAAMLPDLWRMADRRVRPSKERAPASAAEGAGAALDAVLAGIDHHVAVDGWFHNAAVFRDGERRLAKALPAAAPGAPRLGLFAHVLWEMCLDGALLRAVGLDATLEELRRGLAAIDGAPSDAAASLHHFQRGARPKRSDDERAAFEVRMRRLRDEIARGPWIAGYRDGVGLSLRLAGVRAAFGFPAFTPAQLDALTGLLGDVAVEADRALHGVLDR